ncbi:hypothetical protein CCMA1212_008945 [Trichoderma ghanense]|uniref:Uncharacterized protein n=1 Tax=Trichoderma ghanense TaxID=65468 RepID=A0ABY2GTD4_9HYPO
MPARTRKRKTSEEVDALCLEETGAEQVAKPANKTARTTKRKPKAAPGESSKSEAGASKKGRAGVKPQMGSSTARGSLFSSKVDTILKDGGDLESNQQDTRCLVYESARGRIKHLQELMDEFDTINKSSINTKKPTEGQQWVQDAEDVAKVDKKAMEVAIQMLNSIVIAGEYASLSRASAGSGSEVEQAAWRWLEGGMPAAEDTWGSTARETVRAFAGITKLLS